MFIVDSAFVLAFILVAGHFSSIVLAMTRCRRSRAPNVAPNNAPGITLARPLRGLETYSRETIEASFDLNYPSYEVLFCVADANDPIIPSVEKAIVAHPGTDARLLIGGDCIGANPKLNNMVKAWREAKYAMICFADSNLLIGPDYLNCVLAAWRPGVGAVSAPPVGSCPEDFAGDLECAFLNTFAARWQYAVDTLRFGFCQGKTLCWRRSLLGADGLVALADEPAEDAALTKAVRRQGLGVRLIAPPFPQPLGPRAMRDVWARQVRWARLRRATFPVCYSLEIVLGFFPAALAISVSADRLDWPLALTLVALFVAWYGVEAMLAWLAGWPLSLRSLGAAVLRDSLLPLLWCASWAGSDFTWHGASLSIQDEAHEAR